ncbi:MAG TPA: ACT domain-containing protein [Gemmatimonadaceae bacterium]|nr:ACT domain-containing protein [Gemmatimonadaceae bacterium]
MARRVEGRGVSRAAVDAAVGSVLAALEREVPAPRPAEASSTGTLLVAVTARSMPDLASRLRGALSRAGVQVGDIGIASSGLHSVATLRVSASARPQLETAAGALGATMTVVADAEGR